MNSSIHHTFGPLADFRQILRACGMLFVPWRWRHGRSEILFCQELQRKFRGGVFLFSSGREGLFALLQALGIRSGDEIIVQAYTCVVVPNAIQAAGAVPVYVDIEKNTLNLDLAEVRKAITPKTRAVICQHTFGIPSDAAGLRKICDDAKVPLIEDCAHIFPDDTGPKEIGGAGDYLLLSFGRDKAISGVGGGAIVSRQPDVSKTLFELHDRAADLPLIRIARLLLYPIVYATIRCTYRIGLGRQYAAMMAKLGLLIPILTGVEKHGRADSVLHQMPNACAFLALDQLWRLKEINDHRRMLTKFYLDDFRRRGWPVLGGVRSDLPLQKFPTFVKEAEKVRRSLKRKNIFLDDGWTGCVVCPATVSIPDTGYTLGDDPEAEAVCEAILNLPTHPGMRLSQARRLMSELDESGKLKIEN